MTPAEHRKKARLRSERWRRAHGIGPRKPAQKPWLAEGISRSTYYRRRKQGRERAALAFETNRQRLVLSRQILHPPIASRAGRSRPVSGDRSGDHWGAGNGLLLHMGAANFSASCLKRQDNDMIVIVIENGLLPLSDSCPR